MNTKPVTKEQLEEAIQRFASAAVAKSWLGGQDPADFDAIELEYENAALQLDKLLERVFA